MAWMRLAGRDVLAMSNYGSARADTSLPASSLKAEGSAKQESSFPLAASPANPLKTMGQQRRG
jgi:hypothetical protein